MYIKSQNYEKALRRVKIEFGTLIGLDEDKEAYVTLKELNTMETLQMKDITQTGTQSDIMAFFKEILPKIIVVHNLYESENKLMDNSGVADFIFEKLDLTSKVISEYTQAMFRVKPAPGDGNNIPVEDAVQSSV